MSIQTMVKIASHTIGSDVASYTLSNIDQSYTDLYITGLIRTTRASSVEDGLAILVNGLTSGYTYRALLMTSNSASSTNTGFEQPWATRVAASSAYQYWGSFNLYIPKYSGYLTKSYYIEGSQENENTQVYMTMNSISNSTTLPITSLTFQSATGANLVAGSYITVYGIKNSRSVIGNSIKASGGIISFDGTYVSHIFNSSGAFIPFDSLLVDYLVVAGGGGAGAGNGSSGGGGAGGVRCTVGATGGGGSLESKLLLTPDASYIVTVGAGGAAGGATSGNDGNNSSFSTIISNGGGGSGGGNPNQNGRPGGSGGGGGEQNSIYGAGGARTINQGFAGAPHVAGPYPGANYMAGGGGGAGAAAVQGVGGNGITTDISGESATYGGGGGGGGYSASNTGGAGGGGKGRTEIPQGYGTGVAGTVNTGGGAGGSIVGGGAAGGSGVVIIRYKP